MTLTEWQAYTNQHMKTGEALTTSVHHAREAIAALEAQQKLAHFTGERLAAVRIKLRELEREMFALAVEHSLTGSAEYRAYDQQAVEA